MTMPSPAPSRASADPAALLGALRETRERTLTLVEPICDADLEAVHSPLMSPLVWDLGHIAAFEDLWLVHRFGGEPMRRREVAEIYDAFETPRAARGDLPFLRCGEARDYLAEVREHSLAALEREDLEDDFIPQLVLRHEQQHSETMLQAIGLARVDYARPGLISTPAGPGGLTGLETVGVDGGPCMLGAPDGRFSYDNERPRHPAELAPFEIGRAPITNATWMHFVEGGGYERRVLWTQEAWRWKQEYDITRPLAWDGDGHEWCMGVKRPLDPDKPVVHISWFEADAFARAHEARLPTEAEWERAATWDQETGSARAFPWGDDLPGPEHANLDQLAYGPAAAGAHPAGAAPCGALGMIGDVWEWTASTFAGYPGFCAHPYREYSEVFFGPDHRVLRGGSWATRAGFASPTFRNWDLPQRRQIFSGMRIARDA
ncbi:MAG: ergothioneine biosynthesis protein EgtB [Solirubrobacteraceae bacterium]